MERAAENQQPHAPEGELTPQDQEAEEITVAIMAASRLLVAISARALAAIAPTLTLPQLRTLVVVDSCGPVKAAAVATTLGVNPSTAVRMIERLEGEGLIDRKPNPANRREVIVRLTDDGQRLVHRVLAHRRAEIAALVDRLPAGQRAGLVPALQAITAAADEMAVDPFDDVRRVGGLIEDPLSGNPSGPPARP